jgi:hypothetical protein
VPGRQVLMYTRHLPSMHEVTHTHAQFWMFQSVVHGLHFFWGCSEAVHHGGSTQMSKAALLTVTGVPMSLPREYFQ